jgi:hypothetical protein
MSISQILFLLWIAWAAFLFGGLFGAPDVGRTRRMPRWTRMASSFTLVVAAWGYGLLHRDGMYADTAALIAVGMTLCFIGDLFMAQLILKDDRHILGGIGAFGLGHIAYIAAFLTLLSNAQPLLDWRMDDAANTVLPQPSVNAVILIGCWLVAAVIWYRVIYRPAAERTVLHLAALPYALLLATTVGAALNLTLYAGDVYRVLGSESGTAFMILVRAAVPALGALLFFISDFILAARLFNKLYFRMIDDWVWLTYGPGQMLIVYGVGLLLLG